MRRLIPVLLAALGLGIGMGAGVLMRPHDGAAAASSSDARPATADGDGEQSVSDEGTSGEVAEHADSGMGAGRDASSGDAEDDSHPDYVKLSSQFIVPVVEDGRVTSMVILSLSLEVAQGSTEAIFAVEPKLRDGLLQVLFDHANAGGFRGSFTDGANLIILRRALLEAARKAAGNDVRDVLIADIARQDS